MLDIAKGEDSRRGLGGSSECQTLPKERIVGEVLVGLVMARPSQRRG